eukprot:13727510-Heterocapsa_arctica.AAC.1
MADDERWEETRHAAHALGYPGNPAGLSPPGDDSTADPVSFHELAGLNEIASWARTRVNIDHGGREHQSW